MNEQIISFETAKLAKEKGFDLKSQWLELNLLDINGNTVNEFSASQICLPTQALLQKWLREVHNIHVVVIPHKFSDHYEYRYTLAFVVEGLVSDMYNSYEEALDQGLLEALKLIIN